MGYSIWAATFVGNFLQKRRHIIRREAEEEPAAESKFWWIMDGGAQVDHEAVPKDFDQRSRLGLLTSNDQSFGRRE